MKNDRLNIKEQCELLEINRTSMYYQPVEPAEKALEREEYIKSRIDYWHTKFCYIGHRKIKEKLVQEDGIAIGRKLVRRYMAEMNICPVYPKPNLSKPGKNSLKFPYLLKNLKNPDLHTGHKIHGFTANWSLYLSNLGFSKTKLMIFSTFSRWSDGELMTKEYRFR